MHGINNKVLVKVSKVVYISVTFYQKAFIFGPQLAWSVGFYIRTPYSRVPAPVCGQRSKLKPPFKSATCILFFMQICSQAFLLESIYILTSIFRHWFQLVLAFPGEELPSPVAISFLEIADC